MSRLFQINEEDLGELESVLPQLAEALRSASDNKTRSQLRRVKLILSNVRWRYGPPEWVRVIPDEPDADQQADHL